jgi:hypothetical protein
LMDAPFDTATRCRSELGCPLSASRESLPRLRERIQVAIESPFLHRAPTGPQPPGPHAPGHEAACTSSGERLRVAPHPQCANTPSQQNRLGPHAPGRWGTLHIKHHPLATLPASQHGAKQLTVHSTDRCDSGCPQSSTPTWMQHSLGALFLVHSPRRSLSRNHVATHRRSRKTHRSTVQTPTPDRW